jgi:uncharacterized membrane protein
MNQSPRSKQQENFIKIGATSAFIRLFIISSLIILALLHGVHSAMRQDIIVHGTTLGEVYIRPEGKGDFDRK